VLIVGEVLFLILVILKHFFDSSFISPVEVRFLINSDTNSPIMMNSFRTDFHAAGFLSFIPFPKLFSGRDIWCSANNTEWGM